VVAILAFQFLRSSCCNSQAARCCTSDPPDRWQSGGSLEQKT